MVFIFLDPADLLPRDDRVALPDLIGPGLLVVVVAGVLVAIPVQAAEDAAAAAREASQPDLLLALLAPVLSPTLLGLFKAIHGI